MGERILVVEDSATQAQLLAHVLEGAGFGVDCRGDGASALAYLERQAPDLVISDVTMPLMDGYQLCRALRLDTRLKDIPVILLTNLSDGDKVILGLEAGADSFISKPFDPARLIQRVRDLLGQGVTDSSTDPGRGSEILLSGSSYRISASRTRILRYLISTYENALLINERLTQAQDELRDLNARLEERVRVRTAALSLEVAQRTEAQNALQATNRLLEITNRQGNVDSLLEEFVSEVKSFTGCDAVGVRMLNETGDIPYRAFKGFGTAFLASENQLSVRTHECMCTRVIMGKTDPELPALTSGGSFLSSATSRYLAALSEPARGRTCNVCNREGYESVALVPIRWGEGILGLIHVADRRENAIPAGTVQLLETTSKQLAAAINRLQSTERLRESEERFRRFFEDDLAAAVITTPEGRILDCNPAFSRLFGFAAPQQAVGSMVDPLFPDPRSLGEFRSRLARERVIASWETEYRRLDGTRIAVIENAGGRFSDQGELLEVRKYLLDVTERKSLEAQLAQSQKMEAVGRLAGGVAHDFNNMLQVIQGFTDYLLGKISPDDHSRVPLEQISAASGKAAVLTKQLLAFSRKQERRVEPLDLGEVVQGVAEMLRQLLGENVALDLRLAPGLHRVEADKGQIEQVLMNLAANARDAMEEGGELTIETSNLDLEGGRPHVSLAVKDTGTGMDRTTLEHMFEPFFTTKEKGKGTGLGLATVYGMVKQSGGTVVCHSEVGKGTEFRILLPCPRKASE